jgi:hypothetical protein
MVKLETGRVYNIVVPPVAERIVRADNDGFAATGQLHRGKLLFVILLKRRAQLLYDTGFGYREGFDICGVLKSGGQLSRGFVREKAGEWMIVDWMRRWGAITADVEGYLPATTSASFKDGQLLCLQKPRTGVQAGRG